LLKLELGAYCCSRAGGAAVPADLQTRSRLALLEKMTTRVVTATAVAVTSVAGTQNGGTGAAPAGQGCAAPAGQGMTAAAAGAAAEHP
jgi:hypothetical protein